MTTQEAHQLEIQKEFRQQQAKYIYYIIALCVTAIGYSVHLSLGLTFDWMQIPLFIAVVCWGVSVYFGLVHLQAGLDFLYTHNAYFDVVLGKHPLSGDHPEKMEIGEKTLHGILEQKSEAAGRMMKNQSSFFFAGVVFFVGWAALNMYLHTYCT